MDTNDQESGQIEVVLPSTPEPSDCITLQPDSREYLSRLSKERDELLVHAGILLDAMERHVEKYYHVSLDSADYELDIAGGCLIVKQEEA